MSDDDRDEPDDELEEEAPPLPAIRVQFKCELAHTSDRLEIRYSIINDGPGDVAVLNALRTVAVDGVHEYHPESCYADLRDGELILTKGVLEPPFGVFPNVNEAPQARALPQGETLNETFSLSVPVLVRNPFRRGRFRADVKAATPVSVKRVQVAIGVVPIGKDARMVADHPANPDLRSIFPPSLPHKGQTLLTESFDLEQELVVLDYKAFP